MGNTNDTSSTRLIVRIALGLGLLLAIALFVHQNSAQSAATSGYDAVQAALDNGDSLEPSRVQEMLGQTPAKSYEGNSGDKSWVEEYEWSSLLKSFVVKATYTNRAAKLLNHIEIQTR